jgi:large subunit ribosomal protein L4
MKLSVKNNSGNDAGEVLVKFPLIEDGRGTQAVHDTVVAHLANRRVGTACTKTAGEVAGTNKKPWRQKGTGRARAGSFQSPLWRGGGVVFGPKPRDFSKKVNKKTKALALNKAISERLKAGDVVIVDDLKLAAPKTKEFVKLMQALKLEGTAVFIMAEQDRNAYLAARNIPGVELTTSGQLSTYEILRPAKLVFTRSGFEKFEERLTRKES